MAKISFSDRTAPTVTFQIPCAVLAVMGFLLVYKVAAGTANSEAAFFAGALGGMAGLSLGLFVGDRGYPDGRGGWGRVAAVWLGLIVLSPAAFAGGFRAPGGVSVALALAMLWVAYSVVLYANLQLLTARQAIRFSLIFYGLSAAVGVFAALFPTIGLYVVAVAMLFGGYPAVFINAWVRVEPVPAASPVPADDVAAAAPPYDPLPEPAPEPSVRADDDADDDLPPVARPRVAPQSLSGGQLMARWIMAVFWDYALLAGIFVAGVWWVRGQSVAAADRMELAFSSMGVYFVIYLLYQPLGEGLFGGTLGQKINGIRLVEPGTGATPDSSVVARRHMCRIGVFWAALAVLFYWLEWASVGPEERTRVADGRRSANGRDWMFIER